MYTLDTCGVKARLASAWIAIVSKISMSVIVAPPHQYSVPQLALTGLVTIFFIGLSDTTFRHPNLVFKADDNRLGPHQHAPVGANTGQQ